MLRRVLILLMFSDVMRIGRWIWLCCGLDVILDRS